MEMNGIGNTYLTNYSTTANDAVSEKLTSSVQNAETDEEMLDACQQFEAYMVQQMFKTMQESAKVFSEEEEDDSSSYVNMFQDNYLSTIAEQMVSSGQGLGIAEQLYESMKANATGIAANTGSTTAQE